MLEHLASCERCRTRFGTLLDLRSATFAEGLAEVLPWSARPHTDYGGAIAAAERRVVNHARSLAKERAEAPARLAELIEQPPERREMLLRNHPYYQTWGLLEHLIERARERCVVDPPSSEGLARLALSLADLLDTDFYGAERIEDLRARAWGYVGNALRNRFDLLSADKALEMAFAHLQRGTGDILERALLLEIHASLRRAQRRLDEAERMLLRAIRIYREVGEAHRVGQVLINLTNVYEAKGTPERSIPLLQEALDLIDAEREPRLFLAAHHNLITALAEVGRFMEARGLLIQARTLYTRFPDTQNRRHWVAGKIARGLGQSHKAEEHLRTARKGFIAKETIYEAALVSLDLAALLAEQSRLAELKQMAEEILTIFSSQQIHREALAALSFLQQAAVAEQASLEVVTGVTAFLKRLQHDPNLSFIQSFDRQ